MTHVTGVITFKLSIVHRRGGPNYGFIAFNWEGLWPPCQGASPKGGREGQDPVLLKTAVDDPINLDISVHFFLKRIKNQLFNICKIKWPKSEEKLNFGGRWAWLPINPPPPPIKILWHPFPLDPPLWAKAQYHCRYTIPPYHCIPYHCIPYHHTRDVIFRKIANQNQTDADEMATTETKYQTDFYSAENTNN